MVRFFILKPKYIGFVTNHSHDLIYGNHQKMYIQIAWFLDGENGSVKCTFQDVINDHWDLDMVILLYLLMIILIKIK